MRVSIRGGTVDHGEPPLCSSCRHATIARGRTLREELVFCGQMPFVDRKIRFPVTSCTGYSDRSHPTLYHMEELAWVLRSDPVRRTAGFVRASSLDEDERHVIEE